MIKTYTYIELQEKIPELNNHTPGTFYSSSHTMGTVLNIINNSAFAITEHLDILQFVNIDDELIFIFYQYGLAEKLRLMDKIGVDDSETNIIQLLR